MDLIYEYRNQLLEGARTTVLLALCSMTVAVFLGLIGAWAKLSANRTARWLAGAYTTVIRGVPDLVLIMLVFFGGQISLNALGAATGLWGYIEISQFVAGSVTIGVIFGGYFTETFRGAVLAIPRGQIEAGTSCGMSRGLLFRHIILPQMIRFALPGFGNTWLVQLKTTALVSVIGLQDLVYNAFAAGRSTGALFTFMAAAFVIYLLMTGVSDIALRLIERRYSRGMTRT